MKNVDEYKRLINGPKIYEKPSGLLSVLMVDCENGSKQTLLAIQEVLAIAISQDEPGKLNLEEWKKILPNWFVLKCEPEISTDEAIRRRSLPIHERMHFAEKWSLSAWVHWLKPTERQWEWWNAEIVSLNTFKITVVVSGFPYPSGSLEWLLKCCDAKVIKLLC